MWAFQQPEETPQPPPQASYGWSLESNQNNNQRSDDGYNQYPGMPLMPMPMPSYLPPMPSDMTNQYRPAPAREADVDIPEYQFVMKSAPPNMSGMVYNVSQFIIFLWEILLIYFWK